MIPRPSLAKRETMRNFNIEIPGYPTEGSLRVNVIPELASISIRDRGFQIGLDRHEAIALARTLVRAVDTLDRESGWTPPTTTTAAHAA